MNTAETLSPSEQLLSLTRAMLHAAKDGEWERLTELEKTRLPIFEQVFAHGVADDVELAKEVLAIDEQTKSLAEAEMPLSKVQLKALFDWVDKKLVSEGCNHSLQHTKSFLQTQDLPFHFSNLYLFCLYLKI